MVERINKRSPMTTTAGTLLQPEALLAKRPFVRWKKLPATDFHPESAARKKCSLCIRRQPRLGGLLIIGNGNGNGNCDRNMKSQKWQFLPNLRLFIGVTLESERGLVFSTLSHCTLQPIDFANFQKLSQILNCPNCKSEGQEDPVDQVRIKSGQSEQQMSVRPAVRLFANVNQWFIGFLV